MTSSKCFLYNEIEQFFDTVTDKIVLNTKKKIFVRKTTISMFKKIIPVNNKSTHSKIP